MIMEVKREKPSERADRLWREYWRFRTDEARNAVAVEYEALVMRLAEMKASRMKGLVRADEFASVAWEAVLRSIPRYDPSGGASPSTFFANRIRGAMSDLLRTMHFAANPRCKSRTACMSIDIDSNASRAARDAIRAEHDTSSTGERLAGMLVGCTRQERMLVVCYYGLNMSMRQTGEEMGLSEARISQVHRTLIERLQRKHRLEVATS